MVARHQLGEIFLGVTPGSIRSYMGEVLASARNHYDRLIIPCAGRFTIAETAVAAGWDPARIACSDVSLFSSLIGYTASGRELADLNVIFSDELTPLQTYARTRMEGGAVLLGIKLCQLRTDKYFERVVYDEVWRGLDKHVAQLQEQLDRMAGNLKGIAYELADVRDVVSRHAADPKAILYVNVPSFAKGYSKLFDTRGMIGWADPKIPEFDSATARPALTQTVMGATALGFMFRGRHMDEGLEDKAVFAVEGKGRVDYVLCNRPAEAKRMALGKKETRIGSAKIAFLPDDYEITVDSVIRFVEISKSEALYYRDLFAHKLGVTRAERYYMATLDGYLMAVFGMHFSEVQRGVSGRVYETFGFCVPNSRYPRLNRLFMTAIVCGEARATFQAHCHGSLKDVSYFQTTCISTTPEQKTHRGSLPLLLRELRPDGRYKLVYGGDFKPWDFRETIARWIERMANVQRETKKSMGVNERQIAGAKAVPRTPEPKLAKDFEGTVTARQLRRDKQKGYKPSAGNKLVRGKKDRAGARPPA
ncbi:MAG: hypothetical protein ACM31O_03805 [Bacteroidota bacterium]